MTLTITVTLPRLAVAPSARPLLHTASQLAGPAVIAVAEAAGVGLIGRILLSTALAAAQDAVRS